MSAPANILPIVPANLIPTSSGKTPRPGQLLRLASLAPRFDEARHRLYYDLLVRAIDAEGTYNVALTGAYGTGKSSILGQLHRDRTDEVIQLSLSTIAPGPPHVGGDGEQAATTGATSRTNQIQKEIVKQLLYRLPVRSVPRTRFRRTSAPDRRQEWIVAALAGLLILGVIFGLGLAQPFVDGIFDTEWRRGLAYAVLAGIAVGGAWLVGRLLGGTLTLAASVNAGPATVSLSSASGTYFDEYLDEIVYFFQVSKPKVVVIEDIDRFEDVQVFDTLRALNGLLNNSAQIDRRIVFIYAIRDSVFEQIGAADTDEKIDAAKATLERASRTKFFDVIIPVVPFVSADNARDVMSAALRSDSFAIDPALIRLAARHVADMRTIYNIRNEFEVYRSRLVVLDESGEGKRVPGISDDLVFAIILFKNTHLTDFEKLRQQESTLDQLYSKWRELISENLAERTKKLRDLRRALHNERTAGTRAEELGRILTAFVGLLQAAAQRASQPATVTLSGVATAENVGSRETWKAIASGQNQTIDISAYVPRYGSVGKSTLSFSADQLAMLLRTPISPAEWDRVDSTDVERQISRIEGEIEFLRHHTWADLCRRPEFVVARRLKPVGSDDSATEPKVSFDELLKHLLKSDLARDLVRHGFLTSHFALYASHYYGEHLGPDAMEYIRRCIEPGTPDATFPLESHDVAQILREQGAGTSDTADIFSDASVFNVSIIDYLVKQRPGALETVARRLSQMGEDEQAFVDAYLGQGKHPEAFLAAMAPTWRGVLQYVAGSPSVEATAKPSVIDACLRALRDDAYEVDEQVGHLLEMNYADIAAISQPESAERARIVYNVVRESGAVITSVGPLNDEARDVVVNMRLYPVTETNLRALVPGQTITLDDLQTDERVYRHAVDRLHDYIAAFHMSPTTTHTVKDPTLFESIITDAAEASDPTSLQQVIASSSEACRVPLLKSVPADAWQFLVDEGRTDPTFENTRLYLDNFGLDEHLGAFLAQHRIISVAEDIPTADRVQLAIEILRSRKVLPDAATRVGLAAGLHPGEIAPSSIEPEPGTLVARLLEAGLLPDDATSFTKELMVDWDTYEASITASTRFASFVSPELLSVPQIPALLRSRVGKDVKESVVTHLTDYLEGASPSQADAIVCALNDGGWRPRYARIEALRAAGASRQGLLKLIAREGDELSIEHLRALLRELGGEYSKAAAGGRGRPTFEDDQVHRTVLGRLVNHTISRVDRESFKGKGPRLVTPLINPRS